MVKHFKYLEVPNRRNIFILVKLVDVSREDGKCLFPVIVVHQVKKITDEIIYGVLCYWIVYYTQSGYIDCGG